MSHQNPTKSDISGSHHAIFRFSYCSIPFRVLIDPDDASAEVVLEGDLGLVPFTGDGEERRSNTLATIEAARRILGYRVQVHADHSISLSVKLPPAESASADMILAGAIENLAGAKKLLDLLQSFQPPHLRARA